MAYALYIERDKQEISLEEWLSALKSVEGVREKTDDTVGINPKTGEEIRMGRIDGDAEILITTGGREEWCAAFGFFDGRASFRAPIDIESPENPVRTAVSQLAAALGARIIGDNGEEYDW